MSAFVCVLACGGPVLAQGGNDPKPAAMALLHVSDASVVNLTIDTTPGLPMPAVTMVSYAIVYRHGLTTYVDDARKAGVAGLIVPDLPVEESGPLSDACRGAGLSLVQMVTPSDVRIVTDSPDVVPLVVSPGVTAVALNE